MAVSKRLRHEVMRRDSHTCRYCGGTAPDVKLTIDHVTPTTLGGSDEPSNLVTACADCNAGKSATAPDAAFVADVDQRAVEWSQAMQVAVERRAAELAANRATTEPFDAAWSRWTVGGERVERDANWRNSIQRFLAAGLTDQFFTDAIDTAMGQDRIPAADKWRYFCGICWREMDTLQEMARQIASPDGNMDAEIAEMFRERDPREPILTTATGEEIGAEARWAGAMHPLFPTVPLAERFAVALARALDAPREVIAQVELGIWDAMEAAYKVFLDGKVDPVGSADRRTEQAMDRVIDGLMLRIRIANESWGRQMSPESTERIEAQS